MGPKSRVVMYIGTLPILCSRFNTLLSYGCHTSPSLLQPRNVRMDVALPAALVDAANAGAFHAVAAWLNEGGSVDAHCAEYDGAPLLMAAAAGGQEAMVRILLRLARRSLACAAATRPHAAHRVMYCPMTCTLHALYCRHEYLRPHALRVGLHMVRAAPRSRGAPRQPPRHRARPVRRRLGAQHCRFQASWKHTTMHALHT